MTKRKTKIIDGVEWEEMGPCCELCKAHRGPYYNSKATEVGKRIFVINPHNYRMYGNNKCPNCGAEYIYGEAEVLVLNEKEKKIILAYRQGRAQIAILGG